MCEKEMSLWLSYNSHISAKCSQAQVLTDISVYSALKAKDHQRACRIQLIHINALLLPRDDT